jgi:hypothetical protein
MNKVDTFPFAVFLQVTSSIRNRHLWAPGSGSAIICYEFGSGLFHDHAPTDLTGPNGKMLSIMNIRCVKKNLYC